MDERGPSPEGVPGGSSGAGRTGPDGGKTTTEADAGVEELGRLRAERDRLLAERERLRRELDGPPSHPPRTPPKPLSRTPPGPLAPSRRRLLIGAGAAVAVAAVAVPTGIALFGGDTDGGRGGKDATRAKPGKDASGTPSPTP
ncbi:hypothetical protein JBE04_38685, partial [Streptomyces sp. PRKS01-29]|nr:hypothetical protein [Streptomyces sabulosicollis]